MSLVKTDEPIELSFVTRLGPRADGLYSARTICRFVDYTNGNPKPKSQRSRMRLVQSMLKCEGIFTVTWMCVFMARLFMLVSDILESSVLGCCL